MLAYSALFAIFCLLAPAQAQTLIRVNYSVICQSPDRFNFKTTLLELDPGTADDVLRESPWMQSFPWMPPPNRREMGRHFIGGFANHDFPTFEYEVALKIMTNCGESSEDAVHEHRVKMSKDCPTTSTSGRCTYNVLKPIDITTIYRNKGDLYQVLADLKIEQYG